MFRLFELLLIVLFLVGLYTQIVLPLAKGTKLWPNFRTNRIKLSEKMTDVREEIEVHNIEQELQALKVKAESLKQEGKKTLKEMATEVVDVVDEVKSRINKEPRQPKTAKSESGNLNG
jgi:cytochrome c-type biogenesis protein CcmH/NrfF